MSKATTINFDSQGRLTINKVIRVAGFIDGRPLHERYELYVTPTHDFVEDPAKALVRELETDQSSFLGFHRVNIESKYSAYLRDRGYRV